MGMNKALPKERKFSGLEQVQMLTQTAEREREIHRLEHELNASKIAYQQLQSDFKSLSETFERMVDIQESLDTEFAQRTAENIKLRNEITKLRSALNFYADPKIMNVLLYR